MDYRIERIFREVLNDPRLTVTDDVSPENISAWDSFAQVNLVVELEEEFDVKFTMDEVISIHSVASVCNLLRDKGFQLET